MDARSQRQGHEILWLEGGSVILTDTEAYDMRERLRAVEVQVSYMRRDFDDMKGEMKAEINRLSNSIDTLTKLLEQAKGAKYVIGLAFMGLGALATFAPTLIKFLFATK